MRVREEGRAHEQGKIAGLYVNGGAGKEEQRAGDERPRGGLQGIPLFPSVCRDSQPAKQALLARCAALLGSSNL